jgi:SAM-dependent methyltransferase
MTAKNKKTGRRPATWNGEINYALVEGVRPPMYKAMKYWGKKPHNIWKQYIAHYCPPAGVVLDPFVGSGITAFEAAKIGRKAIALDLNPLSAFMIEVLASSFDEAAFLQAYRSIVDSIEMDRVYQRHYIRIIGEDKATVFNYRWYEGRITQVAIEAPGGKRSMVAPDAHDLEKAAEMRRLDIPFWYPGDKFPDTPSINHKFIRAIGGDKFEFLWTRRNLYLLSKLFDAILNQTNKNVRLCLLSGFIQTLHLTCKMVYPRSTASNRDFSGSWGRADYMIRRKSMEQNPLVVFSRSCVEKQGILSAMRDTSATFPNGISIYDITKAKGPRASASINYGIVDVADLANYLKGKSVDFIITDPPYAGLVRYLDLSLVWLVWLKRFDKKYDPDLLAEITIKRGKVDRGEYQRRLNNAFKQMHRVLKDDGKLVVTFHHKDLREWNDFVRAVRLSGFKFDKVTHQYNKRAGESNVANPYGTSASDFYIRCVKKREVDFTDDTSELGNFIIQKAIEIIAIRNEATPYDFIFSGLVPELLQAGLTQPTDSRCEVERILQSQVGLGKIFTRTPNTTSKAGDLWWFVDPTRHISHPDRPLKSRVEDTIVTLLRRKVAVRFDDVLSELFRTYPNGLTPDIRAVLPILEKYAFRSAGKWKIKPSVLKQSTQHTEMIRKILDIGRKVGMHTYTGRREQADTCEDGKILRDCSDVPSLIGLTKAYEGPALERLQMIDAIWLSPKEDSVKCVFEVENTTDFLSALHRASNLECAIPKIMVVPDDRESELLRTKDPLFVREFAAGNWRYTTYSVLGNLAGYSRPSMRELLAVSKDLN